MYSIDFERNFFSSTHAMQVELDLYHKTLEEFEKLRGKVAATAGNLLQAFSLYESALVAFMRFSTYHYLRIAVNTTDAASKTAYARLEAEFSERTAFLRAELAQVDPSSLENFILQIPELATYRFAVEDALRYMPHLLSSETENTLSKITSEGSDWEYSLYEKLVERTRFGSVKTNQGELGVLRQRTAIAVHPDRKVRWRGFKQRYAGYTSQRDLYAFALINLVRRRNRLARLRHFEDAPEEVYFNSYWSKTQVTDLLEQVGQHTSIYKHYQRLRAEHAKKRLGVVRANLWDLGTSTAGEPTPRFSIEQASEIMRQAVSPLGAEYGSELAALLDPANGRMDILPGEQRKAGGFSKGFPGVTTVFYSQGFEGYYNDMRVLMHEATHAVHRQLMSRHAVRPVYAEGPHYLFESFAILNELLLADYLFQHESDQLRRQYYLEQFLDGKGMALFYIAADAALEQALYERAKQDGFGSADDLDALARETIGRFDIWIRRHRELAMRWITNRLYYEDPLYDINYVYGALLALRYYVLLQQNPGTFIKNYISMMSNGFTAPPGILLKRFLGIELSDPQLVRDAAELLKSKVRQLEEEYLKEA